MDNATKQIMFRLKNIAERQLLIGVETTCTYSTGLVEEITEDGEVVSLATTDGKRCWIKSEAILAFDVNERIYQEATKQRIENDNQQIS